jgi:hypothetical protein
LGIYGVDIERPGSPALVSEWVVTTSGGGDFYVYPDGNTTVVQHAASGEKHVIANGGRPVSVSPDGQRLMWQVIDRRGDFDKRRSQIFVANVGMVHYLVDTFWNVREHSPDCTCVKQAKTPDFWVFRPSAC